MPPAVYRLRLPDGTIRLARGDSLVGPQDLLPPGVDVDHILGEGSPVAALEAPVEGPVPHGARVLAPVQSQEVWAAGVTYLRSREARVEEAEDRTPYDLVYEAERPELFFKSPGWRVRGPGEPIAVRADSDWNTPEPELVLVLDSYMRMAAYTIGNDVSSRSIEGANPLYLPQAKVYDGATALGPCLVPAEVVEPPFQITMEIFRDGETAFAGETSTSRMKRSFEDLATWLGRALTFPVGAVLLTGTGIVPEVEFTLLPGDVVRIAVAGLGALENRVLVMSEEG